MQIKMSTLAILPLAGFSAVIITLSHIPSDKIPNPGFWQWDKFAHTIAYFFYAASVLFFANDPGKKYSHPKKIFIVIFISLAFGASDELHQAFVRGRTCSFFDWLADMSGTLVCLAFYKKLCNLFNSAIEKYYGR